MSIAWTNAAGLELSVSRDDGKSFAAPRLLVPGSAPSNPAVTLGIDGLTRVFFEEFAGNEIRLLVVTSTNDGAYFEAPQTIGTVLKPTNIGDGLKGNSSIPPPLLAAATDPSGTERGRDRRPEATGRPPGNRTLAKCISVQRMEGTRVPDQRCWGSDDAAATTTPVRAG